MSTETYPQYVNDQRYSSRSTLNTVRVCIPRPPGDQEPSDIWLIYIHGGAWRDPTILASSFDALKQSLLASTTKVCGFASIDYRLSPYPSHHTHPSDPHDPARNARHPDHIDDVLHAVLFLQQKYSFRDRYVLVGHSCGATLALQLAMRRFWGSQYESSFADELNVVPPLAIVGVDGIYDLQHLVSEYPDQPAYLDFVINAFGPPGKTWHEASPTAGEYHESWPDGRLLCLVHSDADELLSSKQRHLLLQKMQSSEWNKLDGHAVLSRDIRGLKHDEIWQKPQQLAAILTEIIDIVAAFEQQ